jgi:hypothetical protein
MTTALSLHALVKAGYPTTNHKLQAAFSFVRSAMPRWLVPGKEIDAAIGLQTCMLFNLDWRDVSAAFGHVLTWSGQLEAWRKVKETALITNTESSKLPFIADVMLSIVWMLVNKELPLLLTFLAPRVDGIDKDSREPATAAAQTRKMELAEAIETLRERLSAELDERTAALWAIKEHGTGESAIAKRRDVCRAWLAELKDAAALLGQLGETVSEQNSRVDAVAAIVDVIGQKVVPDWQLVRGRK